MRTPSPRPSGRLSVMGRALTVAVPEKVPARTVTVAPVVGSTREPPAAPKLWLTAAPVGVPRAVVIGASPVEPASGLPDGASGLPDGASACGAPASGRLLPPRPGHEDGRVPP